MEGLGIGSSMEVGAVGVSVVDFDDLQVAVDAQRDSDDVVLHGVVLDPEDVTGRAARKVRKTQAQLEVELLDVLAAFRNTKMSDVVEELHRGKSKEAPPVAPSSMTVVEALDLIAEHDLVALPVQDQPGGHVSGLLRSGDIVAYLMEQNLEHDWKAVARLQGVHSTVGAVVATMRAASPNDKPATIRVTDSFLSLLSLFATAGNEAAVLNSEGTVVYVADRLAALAYIRRHSKMLGAKADATLLSLDAVLYRVNCVFGRQRTGAALHAMRDAQISTVSVLTNRGRLDKKAPILSTHSLRGLRLENLTLLRHRLDRFFKERGIMARKAKASRTQVEAVATFSTTDKLSKLLKHMTSAGAHRVHITSGNALVGVVSTTSIVRSLIGFGNDVSYQAGEESASLAQSMPLIVLPAGHADAHNKPVEPEGNTEEAIRAHLASLQPPKPEPGSVEATRQQLAREQAAAAAASAAGHHSEATDVDMVRAQLMREQILVQQQQYRQRQAQLGAMMAKQKPHVPAPQAARRPSGGGKDGQVLRLREGRAAEFVRMHGLMLHREASLADGLGLRFLLERSTDVMLNTPIRYGQRDMTTPLHTAASRGRVTAFSLLLTHGGNPSLPDDAGETALHRLIAVTAEQPPANPAAVADLEQAFTLCVERWPACVSKPLLYPNGYGTLGASGDLPLHTACRKSNAIAVRILLGAKAPLQARNVEGVTPLFLAKAHPDAKEVLALMEQACGL